MAEQIGLVFKECENNMAEVATDRKDACSGCAEKAKCRTCLTSARIISTVQNPIGARKGDVVSIYLKESALWTGAVFLYIVPILWLLAGALIGNGIGSDWPTGKTGTAILLGISGLIIGLIITMVISRSSKFGPKITPRIIRIIERGKMDDYWILPADEK
jgi:sigma-E factor negative regulatory protein RseC